jgi:DNA invertase Pin-like site-specific DNA recombinase
MSKNAIELIRVSTESQAADDRAGIPAQREVNRRTAAQNGLTIVKSIEISDVSGASVLSAPEIQELLTLIESPDIHGVVTKEFSRLMRPEKFTDYALLQHFIDTRTILYLPDGPIDLSSKTGTLVGVLRAAMAGLERRDILERLQDAKESMRKAGKHVCGPMQLPFGVGYSKEQGWFYTPEAEKVKEAYRLVLTTNLPYAEIARTLNMPRTNLRFILQNPIYTGYRLYDFKRDPSAQGYVPGKDGRQGTRRKIRRRPDEIVRVKVLEPIVSEETFNAVVQILHSRALRELAVRNKNGPLYLLNGFLWCALCGSPMYTHRNQKERHYYCKRNSTRFRQRGKEGCLSTYVQAKKIEPKVEELLSYRLQEREFLEQIAEAFLQDAPPTVAPNSEKIDKGQIAVQLRVLQEKKQRILETFYDGLINRTERDQRVTKIEAEIASYESLGAAPHPRKPAEISLEMLVELLSVFANWDVLGRDDKRLILRSLGAQVHIESYTIRSLSIAKPLQNTDTGNHLKTAMSALPVRPCR